MNVNVNESVNPLVSQVQGVLGDQRKKVMRQPTGITKIEKEMNAGSQIETEGTKGTKGDDMMIGETKGDDMEVIDGGVEIDTMIEDMVADGMAADGKDGERETPGDLVGGSLCFDKFRVVVCVLINLVMAPFRVVPRITSKVVPRI